MYLLWREWCDILVRLKVDPQDTRASSLTACLPSFYNICPNTNPRLVDIGKVYNYMAQLGDNWANCSPFMNAYNCTTDLSFNDVAGGTLYTPDDLPVDGTATLSNSPGTVSWPPSGTMFSYTNYFESTVYTIVAAVNGQSAGVVSGTGGPVATSWTAPVPTPTEKVGAGTMLGKSRRLAPVVAFVAVAAVV